MDHIELKTDNRGDFIRRVNMESNIFSWVSSVNQVTDTRLTIRRIITQSNILKLNEVKIHVDKIYVNNGLTCESSVTEKNCKHQSS